MEKFRIEHDFLGELQIENDKYYGVQTKRAMENFPISGIPISDFPDFVKAFAYLKKSSAQANRDLKVMDAKIAEAIIAASDEIIGGKLIDQFPVDVIQGGAGTSSNMNANEVICNRALEIAGHNKGEFSFIHPNNHVNKAQSTNDVYPTAIKLTAYKLSFGLEKELERLKAAFLKKGKEFEHVLKMGRTQLQDAVPMSLGQEFNAWAVAVNDDIELLRQARKVLLQINMGATAIGTGILAPETYSVVVTKYIAENTGYDVVAAPDFIEATNDCGGYVEYSSALKRIASKISKICNDLRLLSSGPRTGIGEINLPPRQPGSSIMPGKVNPVIPEVVSQVAFEVIGNDVTVTMAAEAGQLQLNAMEPVIAYSLFCSTIHMEHALQTLTDNCVLGITANDKHSREMVEGSIGIVTILMPILGYEKCSQIARLALDTGKGIKQILHENKLLSDKEIEEVMKTENMARAIR
ncbi:MAG: aspartate ammonia-lyase [Sphaerochaetaceae bacterium]|jgi:aspartate ammonia-lyase|nr:aspartate ammonia-lyase [Sphaerochaetaceae bacterium]NLY08209.1 aspartate ammonia-lyase [Spirochaetales bacterium]